ncbi:MAG: SsgA family sporulation/cell division regulator [Pseudonocardiaceae bacterium]
MNEITRTIGVSLYGVIDRKLTLRYSSTDPAAIHLEVGGRHWTVARSRLTHALSPSGQVADWADEAASLVHVSRMPEGVNHVLLILRTELGRWPLAVSAARLTEFLNATYLASSVRQEQELIERELDAQLAIFATTQEKP